MTAKYSQIVNKMIRMSTLSTDEDENEFGLLPYVTVSRDPGSGGRPIAKLLAKKLGFSFYDSKLVDKIAKSVNARKEVLEKIDEKERSRIDDFMHSVLNPEYVSDTRYLQHLCKVTLSLAHKKKCVFLGRGINFVLPEEYGLHVRVTAPYRVCVSRAVEYEKVSFKKARKIIRDVTASRAGFVKQNFGKDINNAKYYDVTLNTSYYSLNQSVDLIEKAFKLKMKD